jgi:hypothetical protein
MTFTYVGDLSTDLDKVRFHIGDTVENAGPKPSSGNFTDEELGGVITSEGSWQRAVAAVLDVLAVLWSPSTDIKIGPQWLFLSQTKEGFEKRAQQWRDDYGIATSAITTSTITKTDAYTTG